MNRLVITFGIFAAAGSLAAQNLSLSLANLDRALGGNDFAFQAFGNGILQGVRVLDEGFGNQVVKGKPFSATEERHSLQVLGDGTRIENGQTNRLYRDAEGRTRVEEMNGVVSIYDPTTGTRVQLDPATKTASKGGSSGFYYATGGANGAIALTTTPYGSAVRTTSTFAGNPANMQGVMSETTENLGAQTVNGVPAQGVRTSMIIPKGQIGNNKDIKVMTERWSSNELQMLVKSVNSDPRFGETTYQLSKITQGAPDAALFQVPADYTVTDQPGVGAGRGRGVGRGDGGRPAALAAPVRGSVATPAPAPAK